jgi:hypothetical protein
LFSTSYEIAFHCDLHPPIIINTYISIASISLTTTTIKTTE